MRKAKMMMGILFFVLSLTVTVLAAETQAVDLSSADGKTVGKGTLSVIWAWLSKDTATATTMVGADSENTARGVVASLFEYQNGSVVSSNYELQEIKTEVIVAGNCDEFRSFHALTISGSSTTPLGSGSSAWIEIEY